MIDAVGQQAIKLPRLLASLSIMAASPFAGYYKQYVKDGAKKLYKPMPDEQEVGEFAKITDKPMPRDELLRRFYLVCGQLLVTSNS